MARPERFINSEEKTPEGTIVRMTDTTNGDVYGGLVTDSKYFGEAYRACEATKLEIYKNEAKRNG